MRHSEFSIVEPDRIIEKVLVSGFDSAALKDSRIGHYDQFAHFLKQYDLIGMPYNEVKRLLGPGDELDDAFRYTLNVSRCGNAWRGFEIEYENEKVKRWRFAGFESVGSWITENMIFDPSIPTYQLSEQLIPKRQKGSRRTY